MQTHADRELDEVLQCSSLPQAPPPRTHGSHAHKGSKKLPPGEVERRPLEEVRVEERKEGKGYIHLSTRAA
eukprot:1139897-Pelagomonas_calceolata.AAC.2